MPIRNNRKGDTILEVLFASAIFSLVALISINLMNKGVSSSEASLEASMARSEIDTQAESIRFIHDAYLASLNESAENDNNVYAGLWEEIIDQESEPVNLQNISSCADLYNSANENHIGDGAFAINTRQLSAVTSGVDPDSVVLRGILAEAPLYPRIVFGDKDSGNFIAKDERSGDVTASKVEGIWNTIKQAENGAYEVTIQACWYGPGSSVYTTLDTVIRLYNPNGGGGE